MALDQRLLDTIALSREEYELIVARLGREPNELELGIFGRPGGESATLSQS